MTMRPQDPSTARFTSSENLCGDAIIGLVCRGHSIIADVLSLSDRIPDPFVSAAAAASASAAGSASVSKDGPPATSASGGYLMGIFGGGGRRKDDGTDPSGGKYGPLLFDFAYLRNPEEFEGRVGAEADARSLEGEFASAHRASISGFYRLFERIYLYRRDLNKFADDLSAGYYIQYTVESVLLDAEGRQLLCEAAYLYGTMLILMERLIQGPVRERIVIAFLRYCGTDGDLSLFDEVCQLVRCTGRPYAPSPEERDSHHLCEDKVFGRFPLPADLVRSLIGCLLSDDVYSGNNSFPLFEHRTTRLARQASMLYVVLYFQPSILREERGTMREIADKFFRDNWTVSLYSGMIVDVSDRWSRFEAASLALDNWLRLPSVERLFRSNAESINRCVAELRRYLSGGVLTDEYVLDNRNELLGCARRCNVALRWRILHSQSADAKTARTKSDRGSADPNQEPNVSISDTYVLSMMLLTSRFEEKLRASASRLIRDRDEIWRSRRSDAIRNMKELSAYFSGDHALADVKRNDDLANWFEGMAGEIESLPDSTEEDRLTAAGRKVQLCVQALVDIEKFDAVDRDSQVKSSLKSTRDLLLRMVRAASFTDDVVRTVDNVADMSYAREVIEAYVPVIHSNVNRDPSTVALLRGLFLKLTSCLDDPTRRLEQVSSPHLCAVRGYYSSLMVGLVRRVLDVVPVSVFSVLLRIADAKERRLRDAPAKIVTESLKDYAQLEERYKLSMLTYELSVFTEGILAMETITIGDTQIDPRQILDAGLRKELVQHVSTVMHRTLQFQFRGDIKPSSIVDFLAASTKSYSVLASRLECLRRALENVQDYIDTSGLKMWSEEFSRIIDFNVEQESNKYVRNKIHHSASGFQSSSAPIPIFPPTESEPLYVSFMGRTMSSLLKMTEPQATVYSIECDGWFLPDGTEVCGSRLFSLLRRAVGERGLAGLDRLLSFRILNELQRFLKFYESASKSHGVVLEQIRDGLYPEWTHPRDGDRLYSSATKRTEKLMVPVVTCLRRVGQAQLLRKMIRSELRTWAETDARRLRQSLSATNAELMRQIVEQSLTAPEQPVSEDQCELLDRMSSKQGMVGDGNPFATMFLVADPLEGLPLVLALFVISHADKFNYDHEFGSLVRSKDEYPFDGWPVVAGMATVLKQFHPSYANSFFSYLAQFFRSGVRSSSLSNRAAKKDERHQIPSYLKHTVIFLDQLTSISGLSHSVFHGHVPQYFAELCTA